MNCETLGNTLATIAVGVCTAEPAAYAQDGAADTVVLPEGGLDVSGLLARAEDGAAAAHAPSLAAGEDTCMGSRTLGVQAIGLGVSVGATWRSRQCRRVKNARQLFALGYPDAAVQLLCMDREVRRAMTRAGTPCESVRVADIEPPRLPPPDEESREPLPEPPVLTRVDDVLFDFDRATLRPEAGRVLNPVLAMLKADPTMRLDIEGHTDWIGSDSYNQRLSARRAAAVVAWFVSHGIARERLRASGSGEAEPVASNKTAAGRQLNRRVELRRVDLPSANLEAVDLPTL
jgi:outer membrane protein OmpA-like peptidoglycan-associated protein